MSQCQNIAYLAVNNPFASKDTRKKFDFIFKFKYDEYKLDRQYRFNVREDETLNHLIGKITAFVGKSLKIHKEELDKEDSKDEEVLLSKSDIKFMENNKEMNYNMKFESFTNMTGNLKFQILGETYEIIKDSPYVFKLELPCSIFVNYPIYPSTFDTILVDLKSSEFFWYKSPDKTNWVMVSNSYSYIPQQTDVKNYLKLECLPKFEQKVGQKVEAISSETVEVFPHVCPFENRHKSTQIKLSGKRVLSYNILSDQYIKGRYPYCQEDALHIDYRKLLILKEIQGYKADIICLQETDYRLFKTFLREELSKLDYRGFFDPKLGKSEGVSLFFFEPRFTVLKKHNVIIGKEIERNYNMALFWQKIKENPNVARKLTDQNTVLQLVALKSNNKSNEILVVANTHLYFHPDARHIRLLQTAICDMYIQNFIQNLQRQNPRERISLIFCGDFNSQPTSGVYEFFIKKEVLDDCPDWSQLPEETVENLTLVQTKDIDSAYGAPEFTNYTEDFKACLDYIFYEKKNLDLMQVVPLLSEEEMKQYTALPSVVVPSDHVALVADFKWK